MYASECTYTCRLGGKAAAAAVAVGRPRGILAGIGMDT